MTADAMAMIAPTERSIPPVPITSVKPSATSSTNVACERRPRMVPAVAKLVVKKRLKSTSSASATYTPLLRSRTRIAEPLGPVSAVPGLAIGILLVVPRLRTLAAGDHVHQVLLGKLFAREHPRDATVPEHDDPVGALHYLLGFRVDHNHPEAVLGELGDQALHLRLGTDVDALRRLVE